MLFLTAFNFIAKDFWSLAKLINIENGEVPLLYVYELEPKQNDGVAMPEKMEMRDRSQKVPSPIRTEIKYSYLAICQRKPELKSRPFMYPFSQKVFGTPMLLRVSDLEGYSGRDLYDLVAKNVRKFVPPQVLPFLSGGPSDRRDTIGQISKPYRKRRYEQKQRHKTTADLEEVACGDIPRYAFRLRITSRDGSKCDLFPWYDCSLGCLVPDDDYPTTVMCGYTIAIDWHIIVDLAMGKFGLDVCNFPPLNIKKHRTCHAGKNKYGSRGTITLEDCLDEFSKEEKIPEVSAKAFCFLVNSHHLEPFF